MSAAAPVRIVVPTPFPVGPVNLWLLDGDPVTLLDAGPRTGEALAVLEDGLARAGRRLADVELLVLTHQHADHVGLAGTIQERSGCRVAAHGSIAGYLEDVQASLVAEDAFAAALLRLHGTAEARCEAFAAAMRARREWAGPVHVDVPLAEGDEVRAGGRDLRVSLRPGHSPSDTVFVDEATGLAFVGDHLLAHVSSNPIVHRPLAGPDGPRDRRSALLDYLASLERTRGEALAVLHTGHGESIHDHRPVVDERVRLHRSRIEQVHGELGDGARSAAELGAALWPDVAVSQAMLVLSEVLGALDVLERDGRVTAAERDGRVVYARVSGARPGRAAAPRGATPPAGSPRPAGA